MVNLKIVWRVRKSLGRSLLASTSGLLISFIEKQLCYTAQGVNSCTFSLHLYESQIV
jgi:hypothetical protein